MGALADGVPKSCREISRLSGLSNGVINSAISRAWMSGYVLRTREVKCVHEEVFRGRLGKRGHTRPFHLYALRPEGVDSLVIGGDVFVAFSREFLDPRGGGSVSKASRVVGFLRDHSDEAFFSRDVADALGEFGVRVQDVLPAVRKQERRGKVYVRGYKTDYEQTPFERGYLLTWLDMGIPRDQAIAEAIFRTERRLEGEASVSPAFEKIHRLRDVIFEHGMLGQIVSATYLEREIGCTKKEFDHSIKRALELYSDFKQVKLFDAYRCDNLSSLPVHIPGFWNLFFSNRQKLRAIRRKGNGPNIHIQLQSMGINKTNNYNNRSNPISKSQL